jgi:glycosyltransferase involved in cell wall biosynthesis
MTAPPLPKAVKYLILSDIPTPWREPVYERVWKALAKDVMVVYFKRNEKRRLWSFDLGEHPRVILPSLTITTGDTERFFNPGLVPLILRHRPRVALLMTCIKDPSFWLATAVLKPLGTKIALLEDTWSGRDQGINTLQKWMRRIVYRSFGDAFIGTSRQALALYRHYNARIRPEQEFLSHLVADNAFFNSRLENRRSERRYDVMFSGRIAPVKNPEFFARICAGVKARLGRCRVLIIGDGDEDLKTGMRAIFDAGGVDYDFAGFIPHDSLPDYYAQAKLLLLPTSGDCWGVVINEAMLAGSPVITTDMTAAAGELVLHGRNGYVLPLDVETWIEAVVGLLADPAKLQELSANARTRVQEFNFDREAAGILDAFAYLDATRRVSGD